MTTRYEVTFYVMKTLLSSVYETHWDTCFQELRVLNPYEMPLIST